MQCKVHNIHISEALNKGVRQVVCHYNRTGHHSGLTHKRGSKKEERKRERVRKKEEKERECVCVRKRERE